jgi:glutamate-5-semialdehyde dehydrogenase
MAQLARKARLAGRALALATGASKAEALRGAAEALLRRRGEVQAANAVDLRRGAEQGLSAPLLERLRLSERVLETLAEGLRQVAGMPDPVGAVLRERTLPSGMLLQQVRVPIGTILIIFESRPNVIVEAGSLCLMSGNASILRGGREAWASNAILAGILRDGLREAGLPEDALVVPGTPEREAVGELLQLDREIDLVIPRGGEGLIRAVTAQARMPVLKHYKGICHVYLDASADPTMAREIVLNSKLQRVSVCNAAETLLVHAQAALALLPPIARALSAQGCLLHVEPKARAVLERAGVGGLREATAETFHTEYLEKELSVKVVESLEEAVAHIEEYGSRHTESIVTGDPEAGRRFQRAVDSSSVFVNASTRLADGFEYGLGAEIGISTDKLHARGPMGLEDLTTYKWLGTGTGQLRR